MADEEDIEVEASQPARLKDPPLPPPSPASSQGPSHMSTDDTASDAMSTKSGNYQVIEYDPNDSASDLMHFGDLEAAALTIQDNTPAAEAIRANAGVHVSPFGKAARAVHMQAVRRFVKRATGKTRSGVIRGKPPRIPTREQDETATAAVVPMMPNRPVQTLHTVHEGVVVPEDGHLPDAVVQGTVEASKKVLGAVDPHDLLKLLRWKRKKKAQAADKQVAKSYVKGKVIDGQHELYTLSIAVMIGVRTSISKTNAEINDGPNRRWVKALDFRRTEKYEFRPKGGSLTPPHQLSHTFKFKDYSPVAFAYLRRLAGVNEFDFLLSVCGNANFIEFISNAKSGQFFFYSSDGRFMIKTMTNAESKFLRRMLPQYFKHCVENPNTTITRFFGMYRVKLYHLRRNVKFVIMNSVYYTDKYLQTFYDLKGSSVGRDARPGQAVRKDNDLRRGLPDEALALPPTVRSRLREQIVTDCDFLRQMGVMDYSMLVGVHHVPNTEDKSIATSGFKGGSRSARYLSSRGHEDESESSNQHESESQRLHANNDMMHRRQISDNIGAYFVENGLEEDDSSYLLGSEHRPAHKTSYNAESERKKQVTIEKLYWPFHRLYDIHGYRRLKPAHCPTCDQSPCACHDKEDAKVLVGYNIPRFVAPISDRKDAGLEMDTTGFDMPMTYKGPQGSMLYEGKIFYMGVIDILQEYTSRKALETQYRYLQTSGRLEASCVPPADYGERFIQFFDQYSQRHPDGDVGVELSATGAIIASSKKPPAKSAS